MSYNIGDIVSAKVTGIEKFGFFVLIEGKDNGLVHISEISDSFVHNIRDYVDINEIIRVKVIGIDDTNKLKLSIKNISYSDRFFLSFPIIETKSGFDNLGKSLDNWIEKKKKEMDESDKC